MQRVSLFRMDWEGVSAMARHGWASDSGYLLEKKWSKNDANNHWQSDAAHGQTVCYESPPLITISVRFSTAPIPFTLRPGNCDRPLWRFIWFTSDLVFRISVDFCDFFFVFAIFGDHFISLALISSIRQFLPFMQSKRFKWNANEWKSQFEDKRNDEMHFIVTESC